MKTRREYKKLVVLTWIVCLVASVTVGQTSSLVYLGAGSRLKYTPYANQGQVNADHTIPDFSFAGYRGGGVALPVVPVAETVSPVSGDARATIQAAIDRVSVRAPDANGFRGAVLLKSGRYEVNGSLQIRANGVVLRGEGQNTPDKGGTELVATSPTQHDFIQLKGSETAVEATNEVVLDTQLFPPAGTWQVFDVLKGVLEESEDDRVISFHLTTDANQYVNYGSREDAVQNRPVLELTAHSRVSGRDSVVKLYAAADTYVQGGTSAKLNFGTESSIILKNAGVNNSLTREGYLRFSLPLMQDSIKGAALKLFAKKDLAGDSAAIKTVNMTVTKIEYDAWEEIALTYETRPLAAGSTGARRTTTPIVSTGARAFEIDDPSGLAIGDTIMVTRTPNDAWITALDMAQYGWVAPEYRVSYERIITGLSGTKLIIDVPMVQTIDTLYGGGEVTRVSVRGRITQCGVENMLISSAYTSNTDESHGWSAITISQSAHCWVRRVTARYFGYSCVGLYWAYNTTVEECAMLDPKSITTGSRKYSFYIDKGSFNLFQRCYTRGGRHDYVTGSRVAGPNVFVDSYSTQTYADIGPHHRYATGILFDNIRGGETRVQNRKESGSGHGWAGAQTMFWNCISDVSEFKVESPLGAMNWGIGCSGLVQTGAGFWENWKTPVTPRSLYYQQLQDRLGSTAVLNVTIPEQRQGTAIWPLLISWAGVGALTTATAVEETGGQAPMEFALRQNYPNPFNPGTAVSYQLSEVSFVDLRVYDALGREVVVLANEIRRAGTHSMQWNAGSLPSGVYFCRLIASDIMNRNEVRFEQSRAMLLLK
jgi:hypothetical protein